MGGMQWEVGWFEKWEGLAGGIVWEVGWGSGWYGLGVKWDGDEMD